MRAPWTLTILFLAAGPARAEGPPACAGLWATPEGEQSLALVPDPGAPGRYTGFVRRGQARHDLAEVKVDATGAAARFTAEEREQHLTARLRDGRLVLGFDGARFPRRLHLVARCATREEALRADRETLARGALYELARAQLLILERDHDGDGVRDFATLEELRAAGLIGQRLGRGEAEGYVVELRMEPERFAAVARPREPGGGRSYFTNHAGRAWALAGDTPGPGFEPPPDAQQLPDVQALIEADVKAAEADRAEADRAEAGRVTVSPEARRIEAEARQVRAKADLKTLGTACKLFKLDAGRWPTSIDELLRAPAGVQRWDGPYVMNDPVLDPWKRSYVIAARPTKEGVVIRSWGPDSKEGGGDDQVLELP